MELFVEIFVELYIKLFQEIFPDRQLSERKTFWLQISCILVAVSIISMLFIGIAILACVGASVVGILLTCIGGVMFLAHFIIIAMLKLAEEKEAVHEEAYINEPEPLIEEYSQENDDLQTVQPYEELRGD